MRDQGQERHRSRLEAAEGALELGPRLLGQRSDEALPGGHDLLEDGRHAEGDDQLAGEQADLVPHRGAEAGEPPERLVLDDEEDGPLEELAGDLHDEGRHLEGVAWPVELLEAALQRGHLVPALQPPGERHRDRRPDRRFRDLLEAGKDAFDDAGGEGNEVGLELTVVEPGHPGLEDEVRDPQLAEPRVQPAGHAVRHQEDGRMETGHLHALHRFEAAVEGRGVGGRHPAIGHEHEGKPHVGEAPRLAERGERVRRLHHLVAGAHEGAGQDAADVVFVFQEEDEAVPLVSGSFRGGRAGHLGDDGRGIARAPLVVDVDDHDLLVLGRTRLLRGHALEHLGLGGGKGGLHRGHRVAAVLVDALRELEQKLLRVQAAREGLAREVVRADDARGLLGQLEAERAVAQAAQALEGDLDALTDQDGALALGESRRARVQGLAVPGERRDDEPLAEDQRGFAQKSLDGEETGLLAEGDDLEDVEEREILQIAVEAHVGCICNARARRR